MTFQAQYQLCRKYILSLHIVCAAFEVVHTGLVSTPSDESCYIFTVCHDVFVWFAT